MEELINKFENLHYFDAELNIKNVEEWQKIRKDSQEGLTGDMPKLLEEMTFVNKLKTIERYYNYVETTDSEFNKTIFRRRITDEKAIASPFGEIPNWGQYMTSEEFDQMKELYDTLFERVDEQQSVEN